MSETKNKLFAVVFNDPYKADEARAALLRMVGEGLLEMGETAVLAKSADGKLRVSQDLNEVGKDQHIGHIVGLVAAAATGTLPLILGGTIAGRLIGRLTDDGITNKFLKDLGKELQPGKSALVIYASSDPERRALVIKRMAIFDPKLIETDLPPELEKEITEAARAERKAAAAK